MPWELVVSPDGKTLYVADADSNEVSVIATSSDTVTSAIPLTGDPDTLALTAPTPATATSRPAS